MTGVGLILHYVQDQAGSGGSGSGHPDHTSWGVLVDRITSPNSLYILIQEVCECVPQRKKESQRPDFFPGVAKCHMTRVTVRGRQGGPREV